MTRRRRESRPLHSLAAMPCPSRHLTLDCLIWQKSIVHFCYSLLNLGHSHSAYQVFPDGLLLHEFVHCAVHLILLGGFPAVVVRDQHSESCMKVLCLNIALIQYKTLS